MPQQHYLFHCKKCHEPILLPSETLERTLEDLALQAKNSPLLALACHQCKHVDTYVVVETGPLSHDGEDREIPLDQNVHMEVFATLLCDAEGCDTLLPLFAQWGAASTPEEKQATAATWTWADMTCQSGHPIRKPVVRSESVVSLRCPNWEREDSQHCDATFEHPIDWFEIGKRVECPCCGLAFRLTTEHIQQLG